MGRLRAQPSRLVAPPARLLPPAKRADPFYQSKEWLALRSRRMRDPDYAAAKARSAPGERLILDHRLERKDGGAELDPANTEWLTMAEHQAKTAKARAERARGTGRRGGVKKFTNPPPS